MKMRMARRWGNGHVNGAQAGFTLLEILVVTALLGLLFLMLSGGVTFGLRGWVRQHAAQERIVERTEVDAALRKLLGAVLPDEANVTGAQDRLALTTLTRLPDGMEHEVGIGLGVDRARRLVLRWQIHPQLGCAPEGPQHEEVLAQDVSALFLRYWGGSPASWHTTWTGDAPLLFGVRIIPAHGAAWTELIIKPFSRDGSHDGP